MFFKRCATDVYMSSFLLATCTFTPLYGRLCNVLGRRSAFQLALTFAGCGVLACGCSRSMEMLIVARFVRRFQLPFLDFSMP